ncbi:uncharacterized protein N7518_008742 [Penicillium psychrosexuale]|uniref:uncharacterized protein n=1 Tax=Penicillium psychrosexuale TaxID=1002107 RepID=UPI0025456460|nr:uncharacterized protein N7518_008742 [Penicillium psychrosexuale]KAJ5791731.1 hypothetical protein N7518_008742 [Penicillium psychrosexuale]
MSEISEEDVESFATAMLPLYHGPVVKIRIQSIGCEYTISKGLLCAESPVFTAMFEGHFREAQEQTVDLEEMEGVVSKQSLEALLQWLYLRFVKFDIKDTKKRISAAIELARLADKYQITRIESQTARYIKKAIANPHPDAKEYYRNFDTSDKNTRWLGEEDIISGILLRNGHPVRRTLAAASVCWYLQGKRHTFTDLAQQYPQFGADLLHEVKLVLDSLYTNSATFNDPISGEIRYLNQAMKR